MAMHFFSQGIFLVQELKVTKRTGTCIWEEDQVTLLFTWENLKPEALNLTLQTLNTKQTRNQNGGATKIALTEEICPKP